MFDPNLFTNDYWSIDDPRLPAKIYRGTPDAAFLEDMRTHPQRQPVVCVQCYEDGLWYFPIGNKRLLTLRLLNEEKPGEYGQIWVAWTVGLSKVEIQELTLLDNINRSANPITDYMAVRTLLGEQKPDGQLMSYRDIADHLSLPISRIKEMDQKFAYVPEWALNAILDDKCTVGTAIAIGRLSTANQDKCKEIFYKKNKIVSSDVDALRHAAKVDMTASTIQLAGLNTAQPKEFYARDEIENLLTLFVQCEKAGDFNPYKKHLKNMLKETE
jgi:hypothetical protein